MKITILLLSFFISLGALSQEQINYPKVTKMTYEYYINSDWDSLLNIGDKSLEAGIDFYYLRVRMGVALFMKNNFRKAIIHLKKAHTIDSQDDFVSGYLYKAYLYANRQNDAYKLAKTFSETLRKNLGIREDAFFYKTYIETKYDFWDDYQITNTNGDLLNQKLRQKFSYLSLNFENHLNGNTAIFWGFSSVKVVNNIAKKDQYNQQILFDQDVNQNQYYFKYFKQFDRGIQLSVALNYIHSDFLDYTLIRSFGFGQGNTYGFQNIKSHEVAGSLSLSKDIGLFTIKLMNSLSTFDESLQVQPGIQIVYYPFGNTNVFTKSTFVQQFDYQERLRKDNSLTQALGFRISKFYLEPFISFGKLSNYTENDGFTIFNEADFIKDKKGIRVFGYFFKNRLNIYSEYQYYTKINTYSLNEISHQISYNYQSIIGGITWKF